MRDELLATGQMIGGKYRIDGLLGKGAMGVVFAATHVGLARRVALKLMIGGGRSSKEHEERFIREARVAAMLNSAHAAKVLDVGMFDHEAPYLVMELLDGMDLAALLRERGQLPVEEAVTYVLQACEAVAEAHAAGIVHRDLKPANLFLTKAPDGSPCIKVVDFGIAKVDDGDTRLTKTGQAIGSPLYMSPEQMNSSKGVDGRSDVWSLGVILYELLANRTPFHAETVMALCAQVFTEPPDPLQDYRPDVPASLAAVVMQCLEKDRGRRWRTVADFAAALERYADARPASYAERVASVQGVQVAASRSTDLLPPEPKPPAVAERTDTSLPPTLVSAALAAAPPARASNPPLRPDAARIAPPVAARRSPIVPILGLAFVVAMPVAVFLGLRGRSASDEGSSLRTIPPPSAPEPSESAAAPAVVPVPLSASAPVPTASSASTASPARAPVAPRGSVPAKAATPSWGGPRR